jgi:hypothetical protein
MSLRLFVGIVTVIVFVGTVVMLLLTLPGQPQLGWQLVLALVIYAGAAVLDVWRERRDDR